MTYFSTQCAMTDNWLRWLFKYNILSCCIWPMKKKQKCSLKCIMGNPGRSIASIVYFLRYQRRMCKWWNVKDTKKARLKFSKVLCKRILLKNEPMKQELQAAAPWSCLLQKKRYIKRELPFVSICNIDAQWLSILGWKFMLLQWFDSKKKNKKKKPPLFMYSFASINYLLFPLLGSYLNDTSVLNHRLDKGNKSRKIT